MNNRDLYSVDFTRFLPLPLKNDPDMLALAQAIADELSRHAKQIPKAVIYHKIDELSENVLDVLAYDLHIDWYDYSYPIEVKQATIKDSVRVHRMMGTKYAVETALSDVYPGTQVEEWFEYGGNPYMFRVVIGATTAGVSEDRQEEVLRRIKFYKNLRSHLESVRYRIEKAANVWVSGYHTMGGQLEIYPYLARDIVSGGKISCAGFTQYGSKIEIYPDDQFGHREV